MKSNRIIGLGNIFYASIFLNIIAFNSFSKIGFNEEVLAYILGGILGTFCFALFVDYFFNTTGVIIYFIIISIISYYNNYFLNDPLRQVTKSSQDNSNKILEKNNLNELKNYDQNKIFNNEKYKNKNFNKAETYNEFNEGFMNGCKTSQGAAKFLNESTSFDKDVILYNYCKCLSEMFITNFTQDELILIYEKNQYLGNDFYQSDTYKNMEKSCVFKL